MKTIKERFANDVRLRLIQEFIIENNRVPSLAEANDLVSAIYKDIPALEDKGFIRSRNSLSLDQESSASNFNQRTKDINFNLDFIVGELKDLYSRLSFRAYKSASIAQMIQKKLELLNSNASALLLSKNFSSNLIYAVTENFNDNSNIQLDLCTVAISSEGISQKLGTYEQKNDLISKINYSVFSDSGYQAAKMYSKIDSITDVDGDYWLLEVLSRNEIQTIGCAVEIELSSIAAVSKIKVSLDSSLGSTVGLYVAGEDKNFKLVEVIAATDLIVFEINSSSIKYLKLVATKPRADTTNENGEFVYYFKIDAIEIIESSNSSDTSVLYCGPYQITDNLGSVVNFNRAALSACYKDTTNSWIEYYLSNDNATWIPVTPYEADSTGSLISFEKTTSSIDIDPRNNALDQSLLDYENIASLDINTNDSYLNMVVDISFLDKLKSNYVTIKRNLPTANEVFDVSSGWFFNDTTSLYETTIIVNAADGITLDLGGTSAYLDGILVTGSISVGADKHTFATNQSNWIEVAANIETESDLIQNDPLYPHNHKLLIEGYDYISTFVGNKVYNGVTEFFGRELRYVPKSVFDVDDSIDIYTTYADDTYVYFLVHTKKAYDNYVNETYSLDIEIPDTDNNSIYLKAIFRSRDNVSSSILKSFTIRVA